MVIDSLTIYEDLLMMVKQSRRFPSMSKDPIEVPKISDDGQTIPDSTKVHNGESEYSQRAVGRYVQRIPDALPAVHTAG